MRRLMLANKQADLRQAQSEGRTAPRPTGPMTPEEQLALESQGHYSFRDMSQQEQVQLKSEIDNMWSQIPEHLQEKARNMG